MANASLRSGYVPLREEPQDFESESESHHQVSQGPRRITLDPGSAINPKTSGCPGTPSAFSEAAEESPVSRELRIQWHSTTNALVADHSITPANGLLQRPSSARSMSQPPLFCFQPANTRKQLSLGRQQTKVTSTTGQRVETSVDQDNTAPSQPEKKLINGCMNPPHLNDNITLEQSAIQQQLVEPPERCLVDITRTSEGPADDDHHPHLSTQHADSSHMQSCNSGIEPHSLEHDGASLEEEPPPLQTPENTAQQEEEHEQLDTTPVDANSMNEGQRGNVTGDEILGARSPITAETRNSSTLQHPRTPPHWDMAPGSGPINASRVSKNCRTNRTRGVQHGQYPPLGKLIQPEEPSEEDLLLLLMSRARESAIARRSFEFLKHQNLRLQREKDESDAAVKQARTVQSELSERQEILAQHLHNFKEKYYKLKKWALEANKDCEMLQIRSAGFQKSLTELLKERDDLRSQLGGFDQVHRTSVTQMENIRGLIKDVKSLATDSSAALSRTEGLLQGKSDHLRREQARCEKLEAHISQMERHKCKQDQRLHNERDRLSDCLREILSEIASLAAENTESKTERSRIAESLSICRSLLARDQAPTSDLSVLRDSISSMSDMILSNSSSTAETLRLEIHNFRQALDAYTATQANQSAQATLEDNAKLHEAREAIARLEQRSEQSKEIITLLRNAKEIAENREAYLKSNTDKLINALNDGRGTAQKHLEDLMNANTSLTMKWQTASSQLAEYKGRNDEKSSRIKLLETDLSGLRQEKDNLSSQFQILRDELNAFKVEASSHTNEKMSQAESRLRKLQEDLSKQTHERQRNEQEVARLNELCSQLQEELLKSQSASSTAVQERDHMKTEMRVLQQELTKVQADTGTLNHVQRELGLKSAELENLREIRAEYEHTRETTFLQKQTISQKTREIESLISQADAMRNQLDTLQAEVRDRDTLAKAKAKLESEVNDLREKLSEAKGVRDLFEKQTSQVEGLQAALTEYHEELAKVPELEADKEVLRNQVDILTYDLIAARQKTSELDTIKAALIEKQEECKEMEGKLTTLDALSEELSRVKAELGLKEDDISRQQGQILVLEGQQLNAGVDGQSPGMNQPRAARRAANRSAHDRSLTHGSSLQSVCFEEDIDPIQATGLTDAEFLTAPEPFLHSSTGTQSVVTETQQEIPETVPEIPESYQSQIHNLETLGLLETGDTSSLSDVPDPYEGDQFEEDEEHDYLMDPELVLDYPSQANTSLGQKGDGTEQIQAGTERPPSSSYGSVNDQMLLDFAAQAESELDTVISSERPRRNSGSGVVQSNNSTVDRNRPGVLVSNGDTTKAVVSPRRLRKDSQTTKDRATPIFDGRSQTPSERESTPSIAREPYPPNSAVKRRMELSDGSYTPQQPSKRLKRTPANLEVRAPRTSQTSSQASEKSPSRLSVTFRKSSVVGTNASAPGKAQKTTKTTRKGSKQDKYSSRFAGDALK